jgi:asparagine synthase (glutamine-hydrolysing)
MYHVPNIELTKLQAEAMEIPIIIHTTVGEKEKELAELKTAVSEAKEKYSIDGVINGAIYSNYQRRRVDRICSEVGVTSLSPLWKLKPKDMLLDMVESGFKVIMSAVAAGGLGPEWLGKEITIEVVEELSTLHESCYVCTGGEGGEFETLVLDSPLFSKQLKILDAEPIWDGLAGVYNIKSAILVEK